MSTVSRARRTPTWMVVLALLVLFLLARLISSSPEEDLTPAAPTVTVTPTAQVTPTVTITPTQTAAAPTVQDADVTVEDTPTVTVVPTPQPPPPPPPPPEPAPAPPNPGPPAPAPAPAPAPPPAQVYYKNCTAAREAGAAPVHIGEPGYGPHLDRDGDGIGCE